jgi:hypothetical protein
VREGAQKAAENWIFVSDTSYTGYRGTAAICAELWWHYDAERLSFLIIQPHWAACLLESLRGGKAIAVEGDLDTIMARLT